MRIVGLCLILGTFFFVTGCTRLFGPPKADPAVDKQVIGNQQTPTANDLVTYLNKEAAKLHSLSADELYIKVDAKGELIPGMSGDLFCESPRNFRLRGSVAGMSQVDFGSNNDLFWFWIKQDPSNAIYYCKYDDFAKGVRLPFPFQPEWVLQALGMAQYDPKKEFRMEVKPDSFELIENTTVQGQSVKKITVFNRRQLKSGEPQVRAHIIQDAKTGEVITSAEIKRVKYASYRNTDNQEVYVPYPQELIMKWPSEKISMKLDLRGVTVNKSINTEAFVMLQLPNASRQNLAQGMRTNPASRTVEQASRREYNRP